jgi:hypothetical protein
MKRTMLETFGILIVMNVKIIVFWNMVPDFSEWPHHQGRKYFSDQFIPEATESVHPLTEHAGLVAIL